MKNRKLALVLALILYIPGALIYTSIQNHNLRSQVSDLKDDVQTYKTKVLETQLNYEKERNDKIQLENDLADRDERLAQAAERERAAKVRASRSRSSSESSGSQSGGLQSGAVRKSEVDVSGPLRNITMYCPTGNTTASGKWPRRGMVATISRSIPFGTRVQIDGLGIFTVEDRIGHGSEFDIFTPSCSEARTFGRQHRAVRILS